jgi:hypothetical protein
MPKNPLGQGSYLWSMLFVFSAGKLFLVHATRILRWNKQSWIIIISLMICLIALKKNPFQLIMCKGG